MNQEQTLYHRKASSKTLLDFIDRKTHEYQHDMLKQPYCTDMNKCELSALGLLTQASVKDHFLFLGLENIYVKTTTADLQCKIKEQIEQFWTSRHSKLKFVQLQRIFEARSQSKRLVTQVSFRLLANVIFEGLCEPSSDDFDCGRMWCLGMVALHWRSYVSRRSETKVTSKAKTVMRKVKSLLSMKS